MKLHLPNSIRKLFLSSIYIGPLAFLAGISIALLGESTQQPDTILTGLITGAAGLIIWGCHGMRRRGKRPGFVLMTSLGTLFFVIHLYYRYSDYRWAQINSLAFANTTSATLTHLESRSILFISILLFSIVIGLLPPLPAANRPRKTFRADN